MTSSKKRKLDSVQDDTESKRLKLASKDTQAAPAGVSAHIAETTDTTVEPDTGSADKGNANDGIKGKTRPRIRKLMPPRPFPTVPTSVSATGPRSGHREGKNMICLTRKTSLGHYMRRCKNIIIMDGYVAQHVASQSYILICLI